MATKGHQLVINLPYSQGKCLFLLVCVGLPSVLFLQAFITMMIDMWSKELDRQLAVEKGYLEYEFEQPIGQEHLCDGRVFKCLSDVYNVSKTIPYSRRCDGMPDCPLSDDEFACKKCQTRFSCSSHDNSSLICLRSTQLCDDRADCPRGEDESLPECKDSSIDQMELSNRMQENAGKPNHGCKENEFSCGGLNCIPKELVCNGEIDCNYPGIPYDEMECKECRGGAKYCKHIMPIDSPATHFDSMRMYMNCLPPWLLCDGTSNCADYSDEDFQHCDKLEGCPGSCKLNKTKEKKDDEEDRYFSYYSEYMEEVHKENSKRSSLIGQRMQGRSDSFYDDKILCSDGKWVNKWLACSGNFPTCQQHCDRCTMGAFRCKTEQRCLTPGLICDGVKDCKDGSDEANCQNVTKDCNDPFRRCNGFTDCADGRDEKNCTSCSPAMYGYWMKAHSSAGAIRSPGQLDVHKGFHCAKDSQCISFANRCDGAKDCPSGEDEENCSCYECTMHPQRKYICQKGWRCFKWEEVCDGAETKCPNPAELDKQYCLNRTIGMDGN